MIFPDVLLDVIDWEDEIRIVRYYYSDIAFAAVGIDEEITRKIYARS